MKDRALSAMLMALVLSLSACEQTYEEQEAAFIQYVQEHKMGSGTDYWIEKKIPYGEWTKVVLVFGYVDNAAICREIIGQDGRFGTFRDKFRCAPAN